LSPHYQKLFIKNAFKQKRIVETTSNEIIVAFGGGENWHDAVLWTIKKNLGGIENLSLIPGTVGAAPIQNIGAYGVELKDVFLKLEAFDLLEKQTIIFEKADCKFGYRDSIFKQLSPNRFLITKVFLKLSKLSHYQTNTNYGDVQKTLLEMGFETKNAPIEAVSNAIIQIRTQKLPNPKVLGNAGSFFKNPVIEQSQFQALQTIYPQIVGYPSGDGVKIAAGWLIEQSGWKGKTVGNAGVHDRQALVLVNKGKATGKEIATLAAEIQKSVAQKFQINLSTEVNFL
jgi:UDP-N-acetylmuramate dehydrogenase